MIKDQMNLGLRTNTANYKDTVYCFTSATDAEILPYTIGYIPWDIMEKCRLFGACGRAILQAIPETTFNVYPTLYYFNPTKGVPFIYTSRTDAEQSFFHGNYTNGQWSVSEMYGDIANTNLRILAGYNTDYYVQNPNILQNNTLDTIHMRFKFYEVLGDGSWSGNNQTTNDMGTRDVDATVTDPENIGITFSISIFSAWGSSYTVTQNEWLNCDENGVFFVDGGTYDRGGTTYKRTLVGICIHISTQTIISSVLSPGMGMMIAENFRNVPAIGDNGWACGWGAVTRNNTSDQFKVRPYDYHKLFQDWYGDEFEFTADTYFIRTFVVNESNNIITCGATFEDLQLIVCTSFPLYRIGNNFYVAEFTDDYYITGKLIPYAQAREWQKNIDGDTNVFDYEDIPEPTPGEDGENVGDSVTLPSVFGVGTTNGFVTQYALRKSDIQQLGALLWTSFVDADYWQNYLFSLALDTGTFSLAGLMSFFVSLKVYPFPLVNVSGLVAEGGNDMYVGTGIVPLHFTNKLHSLTSYVDKIEGGYVDVMSSNFFKDWRDYVNTEIILYVPYCGTIHLNPADVVGNRVRIRYVIDFSTGGCVAYVMCIATGEKSFMIGALPGQIGADVPLSATAAGEIAARFIGDAMNAGHLVGGEVGNIAGGIASGLSGNTPGAGGGNVLSGIAGVYGGLPAAMGADLAPGVASQALSILTRSAVSAPLMSGGRGFASFGAPQVPYIQIRRGIYPEISKLSEISGKPSAGTYKVGDLSGFVSGVVKTDGINAHDNEKAKIRRLIAGGIYV